MTWTLADGEEKSRGVERTPPNNKNPPATTSRPEITRINLVAKRMMSKAAFAGTGPKAGRAVGGHAGFHDFESRPIFRVVEKFFSRGRRGNGERARPGRSFPRPRGKPARTDGLPSRIYSVGIQRKGAKRQRRQPETMKFENETAGRLHSPKGEPCAGR